MHKMRRMFALLLIATSGWLLYQTANQHLGGVEHLFTDDVLKHQDDMAFVMPALGGALGLLGGLTVFFNGPGGAALSVIGGVAVAGFTLTLKQTFELDHVFDNEMVVGATMLMLAIMTASITRVTRRQREAAMQEDEVRSSHSRRRSFS